MIIFILLYLPHCFFFIREIFRGSVVHVHIRYFIKGGLGDIQIVGAHIGVKVAEVAIRSRIGICPGA